MKLFTVFKKLSVYFRKQKIGLYFPLYSKVFGVKSPDRQGALAQSRAGDELQLVHVALENYPNNVYIYSIELNRILGRLKDELAEKFVYVFGQGFCLDAKIEKITGGPPEKYFGCNLCIFDTQKMMRPYFED